MCRQSQPLWALNLAWRALCLLSRSASPLSQCTMQRELDITLVSMAPSPDPEQNIGVCYCVWCGHAQLRIRPLQHVTFYYHAAPRTQGQYNPVGSINPRGSQSDRESLSSLMLAVMHKLVNAVWLKVTPSMVYALPAGKQAEVINILLKDFVEGHPVSDQRLKEVLGHTPVQVHPCPRSA